MPQNTAIRTTSQVWDFLEPVINPNHARTIHNKMVSASSGTKVTYPKGQIIRQKDDGTNVWAKDGTSGHGGPPRVLKYPIIVNDAGYYQFGDTWYDNGEIFEGTVEAFYQGFFKCQDLTGTVDETVGRLVSGTYSAGIIELGAATPVAAA